MTRYNRECHNCERFGSCCGAGYRPVTEEASCPWFESKGDEEGDEEGDGNEQG
jgi:hypothetical protein